MISNSEENIHGNIEDEKTQLRNMGSVSDKAAIRDLNKKRSMDDEKEASEAAMLYWANPKDKGRLLPDEER